jgi:hypothetical protein
MDTYLTREKSGELTRCKDEGGKHVHKRPASKPRYFELADEASLEAYS